MIFFLLSYQILIIIGILGIITNRANIIIILMCLEIILLGANLSFIFLSMYINDIRCAILTIYIMAITAAESAIGLAILVAYYRIRGLIQIEQNFVLKG